MSRGLLSSQGCQRPGVGGEAKLSCREVSPRVPLRQVSPVTLGGPCQCAFFLWSLCPFELCLTMATSLMLLWNFLEHGRHIDKAFLSLQAQTRESLVHCFSVLSKPRQGLVGGQQSSQWPLATAHQAEPALPLPVPGLTTWP